MLERKALIMFTVCLPRYLKHIWLAATFDKRNLQGYNLIYQLSVYFDRPLESISQVHVRTGHTVLFG